jgi:SNF2 family DNA or RNA helicase
MGNSNFFDTSILNQQKEEGKNFEKDVSKLEFHLREQNGFYYFFCEINNDRLTVSELKQLLEYNKSTPFLSEHDALLIDYISNRLGMIQTMYKIINDLDLILSHLKGTSFKVFINDMPVSFSKDIVKLHISLKFDEQSNIELTIEDEGEFIHSLERGYFLSKGVFYSLPEVLPVRFYKEIFTGKNKFSVEQFFSLKDTLFKQLSQVHHLTYSKDVENLANLKTEKKVAPYILEIGKTTHFITLNFKYKIGEEYFDVSDYVYAETINWLDKPKKIKIVKEDDVLVEYQADTSISEDFFRELFAGTRIRPQFNSKTPFSLMLPIGYLELFIKEILPKAEKIYTIEYKNGEKLRLTDGNVKFEVETNLTKRIDLLEFKVKFRIEDEYFDLDFLKDLMQKNKKYVQLKDGSTVNIENIREINKWIEFLGKFQFKRSENKFVAKSQAALELDEFLRDFKEKYVYSNEEYKNIIQELKERKPIEKIELPKEIDSKLRDYQKEGIYWMNFLKKYNFGGILADEMGLGKTVQALTVLYMNKEDLHIVICPKTLMYNWENEVKKFFPELNVLVIDGTSQRRERKIRSIKHSKYNLVITSYSMLQKDYSIYCEEEIEFGYKVLDEAHYVKNMKTLSAKAVRLIQAKNRILLTGTPLENNLEELYGTFDLIMPEYLGNKLEFRREFVSKIERNNMIALELLQAKIRPFILRRTKKDVLKELPEKQEQIVYNEMTNKQVAIYNEVLQRVKAEAYDLIEKQGWEKSRIQILSALLKLRQICNHPQLIDSTFKSDVGLSGKYEQFLELLDEVIDSGEKVLVFSQFTSMLDIFEKDLKQKNISFLRLDGSTKNRQEIVDKFNEDKSIKVFLISLKAGGVGLNLTSASAVFLYDPWWNPMAEQQAIDRAHRIGQTKRVNIYKFITKNSIEEKILKLQERKGNMFENLIVEDGSFVKKLEWEDLMELFD